MVFSMQHGNGPGNELAIQYQTCLQYAVVHYRRLKCYKAYWTSHVASLLILGEFNIRPKNILQLTHTSNIGPFLK